MKRRIEQLLNGIFEYEAPRLVASQEEIRAVLRKGRTFRGEFRVESADKRKVKGFIYADSPRMAYEPSDFNGISEKIVYEPDITGMEEGDVLEGAFTVCSDLGEYRIPYHIEIARSMVKTSAEVIDSLEDFQKLAREDFQKAYPVFVSEGFRNMLERQKPEWIPLYEGLRTQASGYADMEEFLVGIHAKDVVNLTLEKPDAYFEGLGQTQKESAVLSKDGWGFQKLDICTDAEFLEVERPVVTTDEFIGSTYRLDYLIYPDRLHEGKNYGKIFVKSPYQTLCFEVTVAKNAENGPSGQRHEQKVRIKRLMERYVEFRLRRLSLKKWVDSSLADLKAYRNAGGAHPMLELYQAHLLFAAGREDEACILLTEFEGERGRMEKPEVRGYYLYLTTFYNKDRVYVDYVEETLLELLHQDRENWRLQWLLLYLQESLISRPADKLEAIRSQFLYGCRSRIMYLEAYGIIEKKPGMLKKLGEFEVSLLHFICREGLLDEEIIRHITDLAGREKKYSKHLYDILKQCYEEQPSGNLLKVICSLLIKGDKDGEAYFAWYEAAVESDIRLTGLYEHYVNSMGTGFQKPLPRMIKMYFSYNNTLNYQKKAAVYANVIEHREEDMRTFENYQPTIEKFMVEQLEAGHINRSLALIYRTFLNASVLNRWIAEHLAKVIFTCEVRCDSPNARYVVVVHRELEHEQRAALLGGKAEVKLFTENYQIFIEDDRGNRCTASLPYETERLLESGELLALCRNMSSECPEILLNICGAAVGEHVVGEKNVKSFWKLLDVSGIREGYKEAVRKELLDYYYANPKSASLDEFLHGISLEKFFRTDKRKLLGMLAAEGMCSEAFALVGTYGAERAELGSLVRICSRNVLSREYEPDDMLLSVCWYCFRHEKYDETLLSYLLKHYDGPIQDMKRLWKAGKQFELDTYRLEEKILLVLVFMRSGTEETEEIFDSYRKNMGKKPLISAYVIYRAYEYFVRGISVSAPVFAYIEREYEMGQEMQDVCLLALLRFYAAQPSLTDKQEGNVQKLLEEFYYRGMPFAFYRDFPTELIRPFQLQDKSYVEYRANPGASVTLSWSVERQGGGKTRKSSELMKDVYQGVFVKEFTLFYGETVHYKIREDFDGTKRETEPMTLSWDARGNMEGDTRYDLINRLAKAVSDKDKRAARDVMQLYFEQECLAKHIFPNNE